MLAAFLMVYNFFLDMWEDYVSVLSTQQSTCEWGKGTTLHNGLWEQTLVQTLNMLLFFLAGANPKEDRRTVDRTCPFLLIHNRCNWTPHSTPLWGMASSSVIVWKDELQGTNLLPWTQSWMHGPWDSGRPICGCLLKQRKELLGPWSHIATRYNQHLYIPHYHLHMHTHLLAFLDCTSKLEWFYSSIWNKSWGALTYKWTLFKVL